MKKYMAICALVAVISCNDGTSTGNTDAETKTNAAANDSTQSPDGMINGSAISTNPNATKRDTTQQK